VAFPFAKLIFRFVLIGFCVTPVSRSRGNGRRLMTVQDVRGCPEDEGAEVRPGRVPFITAAEVRRLSPMTVLIDALGAAFSAGASVPPRVAHDLGGGASLLLMPAWNLEGPAPHVGVKVATVFPQARPAVNGLYLLLSGSSGIPKAILDGSMLTARRTAAASALASRMLSSTSAKTLLVVGTGTLCLHLVEAHSAVRPLARILIWGRDPARAEEKAAEGRAAGYPCAAVASVDEAVGRADIISTATLSTAPLIKGALVRPGTHLDLVGAFRPEMAEADPACFGRARVFVDTMEGALDEAGDLLQAIAAGTVSKADIEADLAALCTGRHPGRTGDDGAVTLFKSVGTSLEDFAAANVVFAAWTHERAGR
jgi:ornithine cyclodeaminase